MFFTCLLAYLVYTNLLRRLIRCLLAPDILFQLADALFLRQQCLGELCLIQFMVYAITADKFLVLTAFHDLTVLHDQYLVSRQDRGQPVRD